MCMAHSPPCRKTLLLASVLAVAAAAPAVGAAAAAPLGAASSQLPINVDAITAESDSRTNTLAYTDVTISQGTMRVQADHAHASGLNFANSRWTFEGHVRISAEERGNLRSDQATVDFRDNHIARATITGRPAQFEQKRTDSEQMARGHADEIVYDLSDGTVQLSNEAWLTDGQNEISGPLLVYNVRAQRVQAAASPGTDQRVHIIIAPREVPGPSKAEPAKPPPPDPGKADPVKPQPTAQP